MTRLSLLMDRWGGWIAAGLMLLSIAGLLAYCSGRTGADTRNKLAVERANSKTLEAVGDANTAAAEARGEEAARAKAEDDAIREVIKNATDAPISDARRSYYECVRLQSEARKAGRAAPAGCGPILSGGADAR